MSAPVSIAEGLSKFGRKACREHVAEPWHASTYWTQLPAYPHQGTAPIRYAHGAFGATRDEAVARLRAEMGLCLP